MAFKKKNLKHPNAEGFFAVQDTKTEKIRAFLLSNDNFLLLNPYYEYKRIPKIPSELLYIFFCLKLTASFLIHLILHFPDFFPLLLKSLHKISPVGTGKQVACVWDFR